jgi:hypothetical protein
VVVEVGFTLVDPFADVEVNVPGVMAILVAPVVAQLRVLVAPELIPAGLAAKVVIAGGRLLFPLFPVEGPPEEPQLVRAAKAIIGIIVRMRTAHRLPRGPSVGPEHRGPSWMVGTIVDTPMPSV